MTKGGRIEPFPKGKVIDSVAFEGVGDIEAGTDDQFCAQNLAVMCEYITLRGGGLRTLQQVDIDGIVYL